MKYLPLFLFIFLNKVVCQPNYVSDTDLYKYSYYVYSDVGTNQTVNGTAFFIKIKGSTYLVSAGHVFTFINPFFPYLQRKNNSDSLYVRLYNKKNKSPYFLALNINYLSRAKYTQGIFDGIPDVYFYRLDIPKFCDVYYINKFINPQNFSNKIGDTLLAYSYPAIIEFNTKEESLRQTVSKAKIIQTTNLSESITWNITDTVLHGTHYPVDSISFFCKHDESEPIGHGSSGTPLFAKSASFSNINGKSQYFFAGICYGGDAQKVYVVKPAIIYKMINSSKINVIATK